MVSHSYATPKCHTYLCWLLQTRKLNEDKVFRAYETIERSAKLQAKLIDDLLDISRIVSGNLRLDLHSIDLVFVIEAAIDIVRLAADVKAIQIEFVLTDDHSQLFVLGDAIRLQQVIWNLLSNAIKFTPKNGRVKVQLNRIDGHILIKISDTGQGISAEFLPYVFDRFRQADTTNKQSGLGLGLAIARHLVELHGGTVQVESLGLGQGATFTIKLPSISNRHLNHRLVSEAISS